jgi:hypothetical protein
MMERRKARVLAQGRTAFRTLIAASLLQCAAAPVAATPDLEILGWIEKVRLLPVEMEISAKLDTGADNSSIHAPKHKIVGRDGADWVLFTVTNIDGERARFEKPLKQWVTILSASGRTERPVVEMTICLAGLRRTVDVNLADRGDLSYPMLIGRSYLRGRVAVDSGREHVGSPVCEREG